MRSVGVPNHFYQKNLSTYTFRIFLKSRNFFFFLVDIIFDYFLNNFVYNTIIFSAQVQGEQGEDGQDVRDAAVRSCVRRAEHEGIRGTGKIWVRTEFRPQTI